MGIFSKKSVIYISKGKKEEWRRLRAALKEASIRAAASAYEDEVPVGGCGAQMDVRDYGRNGRIDRIVYQIRVAQEDQERAEAVRNALIQDYQPYVKKQQGQPG